MDSNSEGLWPFCGSSTQGESPDPTLAMDVDDPILSGSWLGRKFDAIPLLDL